METQHSDEENLILNAIAGNAESFGKLYDLYFAQIFRYLRSRCGNFQIAEDLAEDVFVRAWEKLPEFIFNRRENYFRAWLFRIAHNLLVDEYRKINPEVLVEHVPETSERGKHIETGIILDEKVKRMRKAISSLDKRAQRVITARFVSGLSHQEAAQMLNISPGNVRIIQFRALKQLKESLREDDGDE